MVMRCKIAATAVTGAAHQAAGQPGQDYVAKLQDRDRGIAAVALADGAGSVTHAALGARIVVTGMLQLLRTDFHALLQDGGEAGAERMILYLQDRLDRHARRQEISRGALASTLLFVATDGRDYLCGQVGDGRIARCNATGSAATTVFEPAKGEYFNQTVFVTDPDALDHLELEWGAVDGIGGFVLMSDGAEESLYQRRAGTFAPALFKMLGWLERRSEVAVRAALQRSLRDTLSQRTGDDLSLAVLRCAPAPTAPPSVLQPDADDPSTLRPL